MAVKTKITMQQLPKADLAPQFFEESDKEFILQSPNGNGWQLQYSFLGNNVIYHVWKKGKPTFDFGYENYYTGKGDDIENEIIGAGQPMEIETVASEAESYIDVEFLPNDTYLQGGEAMWRDSQHGDAISIVVISKANILSTEGTDLYLSLDGNRIKEDLQNPTHKFINPPVLVDNKSQQGYWDFDGSNIIANNAGQGRFDILTIEKTVARLVNYVPVSPNSNGYVELETENAWKIQPGYKFRFIAHNNSGTQWKCNFFLHMFRESTIDYI